MAKGGARARSGPPPDPTALRRDRPSDKAGWIELPAEGRKGRPPAWPLLDPSKRELQLWTGEWKRPQAIEWEKNGSALEVALYVRRLVGAESPKATAAEATVVRQMMDSLGLTTSGMLRNRWRIAEKAPAAPAPTPTTTTRRSTGGSSRERLRAVSGA